MANKKLILVTALCCIIVVITTFLIVSPKSNQDKLKIRDSKDVNVTYLEGKIEQKGSDDYPEFAIYIGDLNLTKGETYDIESVMMVDDSDYYQTNANFVYEGQAYVWAKTTEKIKK